MRVCIAEEHALFRSAYELHLRQASDIELVVLPDRNADLLHAAVSGRPDVLLIGRRVVDPAVIGLVERLRQRVPGLAIVLLGQTYTLMGAQRLASLLRDAPRGFAYMEKDALSSAQDLIHVMRVIATGRVVVDGGIVTLLLTQVAKYTGILESLTDDDLRVLELMADGQSDDVIAAEMGRSPKRIQAQIDRLYDKLEARSPGREPRVQAITTYLMSTGKLPIDVAPGDRPSVDDHPADDESAVVAAAASATVGHAASDTAIAAPPTSPGDRAPAPTSAKAPPGAPATPPTALAPQALPPDVTQRYGPEVATEFAAFAAGAHPADAQVTSQLLRWASGKNLRLRWGTGRFEGSFLLTVEITSGLLYWLATVWAVGTVEIQFAMLQAGRPFSDDAMRRQLAKRLQEVRGVNITEDSLEGRVRIPMSTLRDQQELAKLTATLDWAIDSIREAANLRTGG
ncbi:MAG: response regulator transcription factor [SAR202 cluster bacterium]|nr:response regulator transcription factor [SAR202 cluster bacterium]